MVGWKRQKHAAHKALNRVHPCEPYCVSGGKARSFQQNVFAKYVPERLFDWAVDPPFGPSPTDFFLKNFASSHHSLGKRKIRKFRKVLSKRVEREENDRRDSTVLLPDVFALTSAEASLMRSIIQILSGLCSFEKKTHVLLTDCHWSSLHWRWSTCFFFSRVLDEWLPKKTRRGNIYPWRSSKYFLFETCL